MENKSLMSGQKAPLRLNAKQALLILGTLGRSLDKVTIMTLEIRCSDVALKRLKREMDNECLFSGPRDKLYYVSGLCIPSKNICQVKKILKQFKSTHFLIFIFFFTFII